MRDGRNPKMTFRREPTSSKVYGLFTRIESAEEQVAAKITLQELAEVSRAGLRSPEEPQTITRNHPGDEAQTLTE